MNILQIINRFPWPLKDGGALGYYNFSKGYHDAGCRLTIAALNTSKHFINYEELPDHVKQLADVHLSYIDNRLKPLNALKNLLFSNKSYHVERFISDDFCRLLQKLVQDREFDVIVFESIFTAPYLDIIRNNSKGLCILRAHNIEYEIWKSHADIEKNPLRKYYLRILSERLRKYEMEQMQRFDGYTTVTGEDAGMLKKMGCNKPVHVAPTGMDISRLYPDHSQLEMPSLLYLASLDWMPNQEALIWFIEKVWPVIHKRFPSLRFYIAGRNMPAFIHKLERDHIVVLGEVEDAVRLMQSKAIMVVPLFSGSGIRVKILEGMALEKCIISTRLGAQGIMAEDGKNIFIADDAEAFQKKISALLLNHQRIYDCGRQARKLVEEKYENKKVINDVLRFYNTLIKPAPINN